MSETIAMVLFAVWALGLVTGNVMGGAIHVFLGGGMLSLYFHFRAVARARSIMMSHSSRILTAMIERPGPGRKSADAAKPGKPKPSRPSAAA
jgi:hypothetical protein